MPHACSGCLADHSTSIHGASSLLMPSLIGTMATHELVIIPPPLTVLSNRSYHSSTHAAKLLCHANAHFTSSLAPPDSWQHIERKQGHNPAEHSNLLRDQ